MTQTVMQIPSFEFRRRAMAVIRPVMQVLIVLALISVLPGLISTTVTMLTKADPSAYTNPVLEEMNDFVVNADPEASIEELNAQAEALMEELNAALLTFVDEKGAIYFSMLALELLLTPVLMVVLHGGLLDAVYKREVSLSGSLARLRYCPKALGLFLWMMLRIYAWMLPGLAMMIVGLFLPAMAALLLFSGMVLSTVLGVRAMFHYVLAPIALIDDPQLSLNGCIRASWQVMRRRKMEYFFLRVSFAGWMLLSLLIGVMSIVMFGSVIGMALSMMAELLLSVYVSAAEVSFYLAYSSKGGAVDVEPEAEAEELTDADEGRSF